MAEIVADAGIIIDESTAGLLKIRSAGPLVLVFAGTGALPVPIYVPRTLGQPSVKADSGTPTVTYTYKSTPAVAGVAAVFNLAAAAGSWLVVNVTNFSTATLVTVEIPLL